MFCSESCEHGFNATSAGPNQGPSSSAGQQQQSSQAQQTQFHMCCLSASEPMEPPRVGMCFVTEGPEGLSIDCNVPLPNSFNLEDYKKQMNCCPPLQQGNHYFDGFCNMPLPPSPAPPSIQQSQPLAGGVSGQLPSCSCQCCQCACPCMPCYEQPTTSSSSSSSPPPPPPASGGSYVPRSTSKSTKQERIVVHPMMPPFFCVAASGSPQTPQIDCACLVGPVQLENGSTFLCSMIPATNQATQPQQLQQPMLPPHSCHFQTIGLMPIQSPPHLHLQQQLQQQQQQQQESQQPLSPQLVRFDFPLPCLLTDFSQDKDKSCCEPSSAPPPPPPSLPFHVYAPTGTTQPMPEQLRCPSATPPLQSSSTGTEALAASSASAPESSPTSTTAPSTTTTTSTTGKRSCLRNSKTDSWSSNGPPQIQNSYASPSQQCGPGNVCMKCGNCWHCPRCSICSNCYWHTSVLRQNADKRR